MSMPGGPAGRPIVIANCSGFYGDRLAAMREVLDGAGRGIGPDGGVDTVDVVTGDYLAELTMLILGRQRMKDADAGFARTFVTQLEDCLALALERGVRIVSNAGGLNPAGCAAAVRAIAERQGLDVAVATVAGDDLVPRWGELAGQGHLRAGETPDGATLQPDAGVLTANAYLGCWGIVRALEAGAQVVITGRVTDASLVVGPAAWHHAWQPGDLDALAGATVVGHILECGAQATGGNFSLFADLLAADPGCLDHIGFPLAEVAADGTAVITKHPGTGGAVSVATVTEQLLYECTGAVYGGPDVLTRFDGLRLEQEGRDRVRVSGAVGMPATGWLKVATNRLGGWRNTMTLPLTGLDVEAKADLLRRQLAPALAAAAEADVVLARTDRPDAASEEEASALLHVTVKDPDPKKVGKAFTAPLVENVLASIPGFFPTTPPGEPSAYGVYEPAWVPAAQVPTVVAHADGKTEYLPSAPAHPSELSARDVVIATPGADKSWEGEPTTRVPLGRLVGTRSGDKGGTCTLGVYARPGPHADDTYAWLAAYLTPERIADLLPEAAGLPIVREELPTLRAVLFQLRGLLGEGVAAGTRFDPQAKAVGEWLRSRHVDVPTRLLSTA